MTHSQLGHGPARLGAITRVLLYFFVLAVAFTFVGGLAVFVLAVTGFAGGDLSAVIYDLPILTAFYAPSAVAVLLITYAFVTFVDRRPAKTLGFCRQGSWVAEIWAGAGIGFLLTFLVFAVSYCAGWITVKGSFLGRPVSNTLSTIAMSVALMAAVAVTEETMIRGYVLQTLQSGFGVRTALVVSSIVFGAAHLMNPGAASYGFLGTTVAGLALGYAYLATGRLWLPTAMHFAWNLGLGPVFGFPVSGVHLDGLIYQTVAGPVWITGGSFGPEAGVLGTPAFILAAALIRRFRKSRCHDGQAQQQL